VPVNKIVTILVTAAVVAIILGVITAWAISG
jgi:hypothetical protein